MSTYFITNVLYINNIFIYYITFLFILQVILNNKIIAYVNQYIGYYSFIVCCLIS